MHFCNIFLRTHQKKVGRLWMEKDGSAVFIVACFVFQFPSLPRCDLFVLRCLLQRPYTGFRHIHCASVRFWYAETYFGTIGFLVCREIPVCYREVLVCRDIILLPWGSWYAETSFCYREVPGMPRHFATMGFLVCRDIPVRCHEPHPSMQFRRLYCTWDSTISYAVFRCCSSKNGICHCPPLVGLLWSREYWDWGFEFRSEALRWAEPSVRHVLQNVLR
jgi:hypothetical protein